MRNKKVLAAGLVFCMSLQGLASCGQEEEAGGCPGSGGRGLL